MHLGQRLGLRVDICMQCNLHACCILTFTIVMFGGNILQMTWPEAISLSAEDMSKLHNYLQRHHVCSVAGDTAGSHQLFSGEHSRAAT